MKQKIGLIGHGKAGQAVARVLLSDPRYQLAWVARQTETPMGSDTSGVPLIDMHTLTDTDWIDAHPIDGIVDFSSQQSIHQYADLARTHKWHIVSAISAYAPEDLAVAHELGQSCRVMCSPNITIGINFMIMAAKWLKELAPFADVEILEQHFKGKPEISGTALKIADSLSLPLDKITSLRLGGIIGQHEIIFGFPFQTVRLIHNSISKEAFGTGAAFAYAELMQKQPGLYTFEELLLHRIKESILNH